MANRGNVDATECPLCLSPYEDPRFLPTCGHTFCLKCIKQIGNDLQFKCPLCRKPFSVTREGFEGLPTNYALNSLLEKIGRTSRKVEKCIVHWCMRHADEELILVCVDCQMAVCERCHEETHNRHRMSALRKFVQESVNSLNNDAKEVDKNLLQIAHKKKELNSRKEEFLHQITDQELAINREFQSIKLYLDSEKDKLVEELKLAKQSVLKSHESNNKELEHHEETYKSLKMSIQRMNKRMEMGTNFTLVSKIKELKERLRDLSTAKTDIEKLKVEEQQVTFTSADLKNFLMKQFVTYERPNVIGKLQFDHHSEKKDHGPCNEGSIDLIPLLHKHGHYLPKTAKTVLLNYQDISCLPFKLEEPFGFTSATMFLPSEMFRDEGDMQKQLHEIAKSCVKFQIREDGFVVLEGDYMDTCKVLKKLEELKQAWNRRSFNMTN